LTGNIRRWVEEVLEPDEVIEAVVIGEFGWGYGWGNLGYGEEHCPKQIPWEKRGIPLSWDEAKEMLDYFQFPLLGSAELHMDVTLLPKKIFQFPLLGSGSRKYGVSEGEYLKMALRKCLKLRREGKILEYWGERTIWSYAKDEAYYKIPYWLRDKLPFELLRIIKCLIAVPIYLKLRLSTFEHLMVCLYADVRYLLFKKILEPYGVQVLTPEEFIKIYGGE